MGPIGPAKCRGRSLHRQWADNDEANRAGREWGERASVGWEFHPGGMAVVSQESVPTSSDIPWVRSDQQNVAGGAYTADGLTTTRLTGPEVSGEDEPLSGGNFILEEWQLLASECSNQLRHSVGPIGSAKCRRRSLLSARHP